MTGGRNAKGHLLLGVLVFFGILAATLGVELAVVALLAVGPVVTLAALVGVAAGVLVPDSVSGLLVSVLFSLLTVLVLVALAVSRDSDVGNLLVLFGLVVDFLAGLGTVLSVTTPDDTERPTPGPPHGF